MISDDGQAQIALSFAFFRIKAPWSPSDDRRNQYLGSSAISPIHLQRRHPYRVNAQVLGASIQITHIEILHGAWLYLARLKPSEFSSKFGAGEELDTDKTATGLVVSQLKCITEAASAFALTATLNPFCADIEG